MDNLSGLFGIRSMDRVPNARMRELCGMTKGVDKMIDVVLSCGSTMWRRWRRKGELLRGYVGECVVVVQ